MIYISTEGGMIIPKHVVGKISDRLFTALVLYDWYIY